MEHILAGGCLEETIATCRVREYAHSYKKIGSGDDQ